MSFLFGKSKKNQPVAVSAATRDLASSHGPDSRMPTTNGLAGPREGMERRATVGNQTPDVGINSSLNSINPIDPPRMSSSRDRAESDVSVARNHLHVPPSCPAPLSLLQNLLSTPLPPSLTNAPSRSPEQDRYEVDPQQQPHQGTLPILGRSVLWPLLRISRPFHATALPSTRLPRSMD
jgi:hypothetical protein